MNITKHIILIGFKHVGKTAIGKKLAEHLHSPFIDSDLHLELLYAQKTQKKLSCRQIMQAEGQKYFRDLEHQILQQIITLPASIIAVGGGTVLAECNQRILNSQLVIHVTAPKEIVYERIIKKGNPAFFTDDEPMEVTFNRLWKEREGIYKKLATLTIENDSTLEKALENCLQILAEVIDE